MYQDTLTYTYYKMWILSENYHLTKKTLYEFWAWVLILLAKIFLAFSLLLNLMFIAKHVVAGLM